MSPTWEYNESPNLCRKTNDLDSTEAIRFWAQFAGISRTHAGRRCGVYQGANVLILPTKTILLWAIWQCVSEFKGLLFLVGGYLEDF